MITFIPISIPLLRRRARLCFLLRLFLLQLGFFACPQFILLPASTHYHQGYGYCYQKQHAGEFIGRYDAEIVLLSLGYLIFESFLEFSPLVVFGDALQVLLVAGDIVHYHLIVFAGLLASSSYFVVGCWIECLLKQWNLFDVYNFFIYLRLIQIFAYEGGDFDDTLLASNFLHTLLDQFQGVQFSGNVVLVIILSGHKPASQQHLHAPSLVFLLKLLQILSIHWLQHLISGKSYHQQQEGCSHFINHHPIILIQMMQAEKQYKKSGNMMIGNWQIPLQENHMQIGQYNVYEQSPIEKYNKESEERNDTVMIESITLLRQRIKEMQLMIDLQRATKDFLIKRVGQNKQRLTDKKQNKVVECASQYLQKSLNYCKQISNLNKFVHQV